MITIAACKPEEPEPVPQLQQGDPCDPNVEPPAADESEGETGEGEQEPYCAPGLACDPLANGSGHVCGPAYEIQGRVFDALSTDPVEGALVAAFDDTGAPVTDVVESDACGDYVLPLSLRRDENGDIVEMPKWTLNVSAADYYPFPAGIRPALPLSVADAVPEVVENPEAAGAEGGTGDEVMLYEKYVIANSITNVGLIPLEGEDAGGVTVRGSVDSEFAPGTLVVAEGGSGRSSYAIADASGNFTLFNVHAGNWTVRGYRWGLELEPAEIAVDADVLEGVSLVELSSDIDAMGTVEGSINIVNAAGLTDTSVVLVPSSLFNDALERGPVPFGLRDPDPPNPVADLSGGFFLDGVPAGTYKVLAAFENDELVRDPDSSIAGTAIQEVSVGVGEAVTVDTAFKVTEALAVIGPGADEPEQVDASPTLIWADDSSEDFYELLVFDSLGNIVWEQPMVPGVSGSDTVEVPYGGPALDEGMFYQFRATSFRDPPGGPVAVSRTEDLRGVFVFGEPPPLDECVPE